MLLLSDTDTYSGDWKDVVVVGGGVVDEDNHLLKIFSKVFILVL